MADFRISDLSPASILHEGDLYETSQPDNNSSSGYASLRVTNLALATFILKSINFADLSTTAKNIVGAINEVMNIASTIPTFAILVVPTLPTQDISTTTIYLTPSTDPTQSNAYDEFIYVNNAWEFVGSTNVDLTNYYTKSEVDTLLNGKVDSVPGKGLSTDDFHSDGAYKTLGAGKAVMNTYDSLGNYDGIYTERVIPAAGAEKLVLEKIQGATVCLNQLLPISPAGSYTTSGIAVTNNNDGTFTLNGTWDNNGFNYWILGGYNQTVEVFSFKANHVYLTSGTAYYNVTTSLVGGSGLDIFKISKFSEDKVVTGVKTANPQTASQTFTNYKYCPMIIDLTAMFGIAIADRVYTLEQATAGSGIAWLKSQGYDLTEYHAFNAGSLESVSVSAHNTVGFNQFDKSTIIDGYYINASGNSVIKNGFYHSDYIKCFPNTIYYSNANTNSETNVHSFYDINKVFISNNSIHDGTFTTPNNAFYMRVNCKRTSVSENSLCINISNASLNGQYKPYTSTEYPTDHTALRGILGLSASNTIEVAVGDEQTNDGERTVKMGESDMGGLNWGYSAGAVRFYAQLSDASNSPCISEKYPYYYRVYVDGDRTDKVICIYNGYVYVRDSAYTDATAFKTAMNGVKLVYPILTPTTEQGTPYHAFQTVEAGGTEAWEDYGVQQGTRDIVIPPMAYEEFYEEGSTTVTADVPPMPPIDGTYKQTLTVVGGVPRFEWVQE